MQGISCTRQLKNFASEYDKSIGPWSPAELYAHILNEYVGGTTLLPLDLCVITITQRSNFAGGRRSRAGRALAVAGRPGEGALLGGLGRCR